MKGHLLICKILRGENVLVENGIAEKTVLEVLKAEKVPFEKHITPEGVPGYLIPDAEYDFMYIFLPIDIANESIKKLIRR